MANVNFNSNIKSNLNSVEKTALKDLKSNDNIVITKVDKDSHIVVIDKKQ